MGEATPLFLLNTVLFPGGLLPLKVFEQRYMDLVKDCLRNDTTFGVCLIKEGREVGPAAVPERVGCIARIVDWDMPQFGVLHVQTHGVQRFRIEDYQDNGKGLLLAQTSALENEAQTPISEEFGSCAHILRAIIDNTGEQYFPKPLAYDDAVWVSYRLAEILPMKLALRQRLMEMNDTEARLRALTQLLKESGLRR